MSASRYWRERRHLYGLEPRERFPAVGSDEWREANGVKLESSSDAGLGQIALTLARTVNQDTVNQNNAE